MKIVVLFPTITEAKYFKRDDVEVIFSGVGLIPTAFSTYKAILDTAPDVIIMGGIAGVYKTSSLKIGDTVLVSDEHQADLGLFFADGFQHLGRRANDMSFDVLSPVHCRYATEVPIFRTAVSNSMNCGMAEFVDTDGVDIENMEGASFFYVCSKLGVKFFEVRTISNVVDVNHDDWDYETSIKNLADGLNKLVDYLKL
ncbi:MAG: hypothetical protein RR141_05260 [Rikenellaceae bacterium]